MVLCNLIFYHFTLSVESERKLKEKLHQTELRVASLDKAVEGHEEMSKKADCLRRAAESAITLEKETSTMLKSQLEKVKS